MKIEFAVGEKTAEFHRNWFTGSTKLVVDGIAKPLSDPMGVSTHFSVSRVQTWTLAIFGHQVEIKKTRPPLLAGFRPQHYLVTVDCTPVAERSGY